MGIGVTPQYELERSSRACSATAPPSVRAAQAPPSVHAAREPPSVRAARVPPSVRTAKVPSSARSSQVRSSACSSQVHSNAHSSRDPTRAPPSGHPPEPTPPEGPPDVVDFHNNFFGGGGYMSMAIVANGDPWAAKAARAPCFRNKGINPLFRVGALETSPGWKNRRPLGRPPGGYVMVRNTPIG